MNNEQNRKVVIESSARPGHPRTRSDRTRFLESFSNADFFPLTLTLGPCLDEFAGTPLAEPNQHRLAIP